MDRDRSFPPKVLRFSELKMMAKNAASFRAAYEEPREETAPMLFGTLCHTLILGGESYVVYEADRRGNAWKDFQAANVGRMIVTAKELAKAKRVADAVRRDPVAAPLLEGVHERELSWDMLGRKFGGRADVIGPDCVVDVKTTNYAEPGYFSRAALRMAYHVQAGMYFDGAVASGFPVKESWVIAVETAVPFSVTVLHMTPRALDEGRKILRGWVERVAACEAAGEWPGYVQSAVDLDVVEDAGLIIDGEVVAA